MHQQATCSSYLAFGYGCRVHDSSARPARPPARSPSAPRRSVAAAPVAVQSMCATKTRDVDVTVAQTDPAATSRRNRGAGRRRQRQGGRCAARDPPTNHRCASRSTCKRITGWRKQSEPHVDKIRYNPGHLYHVEREKPMAAKVRWLVDVAGDTDCAIRIGVNCGSVAPEFLERYPATSSKRWSSALTTAS